MVPTRPIVKARKSTSDPLRTPLLAVRGTNSSSAVRLTMSNVEPSGHRTSACSAMPVAPSATCFPSCLFKAWTSASRRAAHRVLPP